MARDDAYGFDSAVNGEALSMGAASDSDSDLLTAAACGWTADLIGSQFHLNLNSIPKTSTTSKLGFSIPSNSVPTFCGFESKTEECLTLTVAKSCGRNRTNMKRSDMMFQRMRGRRTDDVEVYYFSIDFGTNTKTLLLFIQFMVSLEAKSFMISEF